MAGSGSASAIVSPLVVPTLILAGLVLLLGGGWLLRLGLRGRRVDDAPLCRACGFELTGLPAGSNCPECGADVGRPEAVTVGHRRRRPGAILLGLALLLVPLMVGGTLVSGIDPTPYKPAWWLLRELDARDPATVSAALAELGRRQAAGGLSASAVDALVKRALAVQADPAAPWDKRWGGFVEVARAAGTLDDARWSRYARQAFDFKLKVRPRVRQGDPLPVDFTINSPRLGPTASFGAWYEWSAVRVGGTSHAPAKLGLEPGAIGVRVGSWGETGQPSVGGDVTESLPPGPTTVAGTVRFWVGPSSGISRPSMRPSPALAAGQVDVVAALTVLPRDAPAEFVVNDPALAGPMRAAVSVELRHDSSVGMRYLVTVSHNPTPLHHRLLARRGGKEVPLDDLPVQFSADTTIEAFDGIVDDPAIPFLAAGGCDLILRPDLDAIKHSTDPTRPWGGELVFKNVPIQPAEK